LEDFSFYIIKLNTTHTKTNSIVGKTLSELGSIIQKYGFEKFRADQIFNWIYKNNVNSFDEMKNIPNDLLGEIANNYVLNPLQIIKITGDENSATQKFLLECTDGEKIEAVLMREKDRITVCLSSQVGCALDCKFCATGTMGIRRNLTVGEIIAQYLILLSNSNNRITNVVFMGMGEPFLNYENVMKAAKLLNNSDGINIGARHITISTAGVIPGIKKFTEDQIRYKLAVSLNAADQEQRKKIMPIAKKYNLDELLESARQYYNTTRNFITFEYVLMDGINDSVEDAKKIIDLINDLPCKLNVIPYNEIDGIYKRPVNKVIDNFLKNFDNVPFTVTTRWSKGSDINAGCGQLAVK